MRARTIAIAPVAVVVAALAAGAAQAAAPRIVIFSGKPAPHRVVIADWQAIFRVVEQLASAPATRRSAGLGARPHLKVSMFWGPRWIDYLDQGNRASALRPRQADQVGSFYPAWRGSPAFIDLPWAGRWPRVVPPTALAILKRFDVPTRLGHAPPSAGRGAHTGP